MEVVPRNSVMVTYFEDARILNNGKMDVTTAFARQLARSNRGREDIDFERIDGLDTVVAAFHLNPGLDSSMMLIVCIDELIRLRNHVAVRWDGRCSVLSVQFSTKKQPIHPQSDSFLALFRPDRERERVCACPPANHPSHTPLLPM